MITFVARLTVPPEHQAALEALLGHVRDMTLAHEPGVLWYGFGRSADEADAYLVVEVYRDADAHAAHMEAAWVKETVPEALRLTGGAIAIEQYVSPGTPPAVRRMREA